MKRVIVICIFVFSILWLYAIDYVAISEVMYDTPFNENLSIYPHCIGEYIELYNADEDSVDLSNWSLHTFSPNQSFFIPEGTILEPHSFLLIAYGAIDPYHLLSFAEESDGMTDIHKFYNLCVECTPVILQEDLILYNAITSLVLKDQHNVTRDSMVYHASQKDGSCYATNSDVTTINQNTSLTKCYSVQRITINFNVNGTTIGQYQGWGGKHNASTSNELYNNSPGYPSKTFFADIHECNADTNTNVINDKKLAGNFVQEITPHTAMSTIDTSQLFTSSLSATIKRTYYDPLYRPTFTFLYNHTPDRNNLVTLKEYDVYARPTKEWLPISVEFNTLTHETFENNALQFYSNDSRPFVENTYSTDRWDNGALKNQLVASQKQGDDLNSHKTQFISRGNTSNEVRLFYVTSDGDLGCSGYYRDSMMCVEEIFDEDDKSKIKYTNIQGQIVMEKVDNAITYYVYNDLNQLCYVLPPLAVSQLGEGEYNEDNDVLKKYAYVYKYDKRGNQIYKRLPGCEPILMVYDKTNSLVLSQTGNQRVKGTFWTTYKYDDLRRLIYTAEVNTGRNDHAGLVEEFSKFYVVEYFSTTNQQYPMKNTGYSRNFYASQSTSLLTVNYYDNYDFMSFLSDYQQSIMSFSEFDDNNMYANAKGLLTGSRTYSLKDSRIYSETVYYYDYRGREIQRRTLSQHIGGHTILSTKYDFTNNITDTWTSQTTKYGTSVTEHYHYEYDHANRLKTTTYTFNDEAPITLQSYHYDELGRVRSRQIHGGIDSVAFAYDIRNQITQIKSSGYEQKYYYNQACPIGNNIVRSAYNGNISATTWTYGNKLNGYLYYYDSMNRLQSTYSIIDSIWSDNLYTESFYYDTQGNIIRLDRWDSHDLMNNLTLSYDGNQLISVDDDGYGSYLYATKQYHDNSTLGNDFAYDANGNMLYDKDRGIAAIRYNLLNLPDTIQFTNGNQIVNHYDAAGNRLITNYYTRKITTTVPLGNVLTGTNSTSASYITRDAFNNNIVYAANNNDPYGIEFVHNPEGYIRYYGPSEHYHFYHVKDHLGNIRETYIHPDANYKECVERTQYYPSGLPWPERLSDSSTAHPWKYNGKEFVEMHGLDEYDSKARWYYPAICRTTTMDPLSEKYYPTSPYAWCGNNPISNVDLDGMDVWELNANGEVIHHRQNSQVDSLYVTNSYGKTSGIEFAYGTIQNMSTNHKFAKDAEGNIYPVSLDVWNISTEEHAKTIFKFFADNTDVEWSWINATKSGLPQYFLTTIHQKDKEGGHDYLFKRGFTIHQHTHSHPYKPEPSTADKSWANKLLQDNPNAILEIYYYLIYYQYDQNGFKITH